MPYECAIHSPPPPLAFQVLRISLTNKINKKRTAPYLNNLGFPCGESNIPIKRGCDPNWSR